jgi:hypothetical protein
MPQKFHFISGLPRSGSTLLAAIKQTPFSSGDDSSGRFTISWKSESIGRG